MDIKFNLTIYFLVFVPKETSIIKNYNGIFVYLVNLLFIFLIHTFKSFLICMVLLKNKKKTIFLTLNFILL